MLEYAPFDSAQAASIKDMGAELLEPDTRFMGLTWLSTGAKRLRLHVGRHSVILPLKIKRKQRELRSSLRKSRVSLTPFWSRLHELC